MNFFSKMKRPGATAAGIFSLALGSVVLLCGAGSVPVENFTPQGPMQSDLNAGGHNLTNVATLSAANLAISGTLTAANLGSAATNAASAFAPAAGPFPWSGVTGAPALQTPLTLTTTGSGAATLSGSTLNIPTPSAGGVASFNTRTGAIMLQASDLAISGAALTALPSTTSLYPTLNQNTTGSAATVAAGGSGTFTGTFTGTHAGIFSGTFSGTHVGALTGTATNASSTPLSGVTGLGSGVGAALANAANASGGVATVNGSFAMNVAPAGSVGIVFGDSRAAGYPIDLLAASAPQYAVSYTGPGKCWPQWLSAQPYFAANSCPIYDYGIGGATTMTGTAVIGTSTPYSEYLNGALVGNYAGSSGPSALPSSLRPTAAGTVAYVFIDYGINDCNGIGLASETLATFESNIGLLCSTAHGWGSNVKVCLETFPFGNYSGLIYKPWIAEQMWDWERSQTYVDTNSTNPATADYVIEEAALFPATITGAGPTSSSGTYTQSSIWYDGLHMNSNGYRIYAQEIAAELGNPNYNSLPKSNGISGVNDAAGKPVGDFIHRVFYDSSSSSIIDFSNPQQVFIDGAVSGAVGNGLGLVVSPAIAGAAESLDVHGTNASWKRSALRFSNNYGSTYTLGWEVGTDGLKVGANDFYFYNDVAGFNGLDLPAASSGTVTMGATGGLQISGPCDTSAAQTIVAGSSAGNVTFSQPFQGTSYKKVVIGLGSSLSGTASYTFPTVFSTTPVVINGDAAVTSLSTTAVTVTGTLSLPRTVILEGY